MPWIVAACALALYAATAAPWLTWANDGADGGDLITAAMVAGVPHPSGYPTYCLLGRLFALLPLGSVARRFNLLSAVAAAGTVGLLSFCMLHVLGQTSHSAVRALVALGVGLAAAAAPALWSQATISEVYALNALFFAALLYIALRRPLSPGGWAICGGLLGLGLGNHLTLLFVTPALAMLLAPIANRRRILAGAAGLLLGLSVYLYLPLAARADPPVNWGNPRTWPGFWWLVSAQAYHGYAFALPWRYVPSRLGAWLRLAIDQYTLLGFALALNGLWSWIESGARRWALATGLIVALFTGYALLYNTIDSYVYLIPAHLVVALWMGEGARNALDLLAATRVRRAALPLVASVLLLIPTWSLVRHLPTLNLLHEQEARRWTEQIEQALPPGALVITGADAHTFTLHYARWVEGRRPDLLVVDGELLWQPWYVDQLPTVYPALSLEAPERAQPADTLLDGLIAANLPARPVYLTTRREPLEERYLIEARGPFLWQVIEAR